MSQSNLIHCQPIFFPSTFHLPASEVCRDFSEAGVIEVLSYGPLFLLFIPPPPTNLLQYGRVCGGAYSRNPFCRDSHPPPMSRFLPPKRSGQAEPLFDHLRNFFLSHREGVPLLFSLIARGFSRSSPSFSYCLGFSIIRVFFLMLREVSFPIQDHTAGSLPFFSAIVIFFFFNFPLLPYCISSSLTWICSCVPPIWPSLIFIAHMIPVRILDQLKRVFPWIILPLFLRFSFFYPPFDPLFPSPPLWGRSKRRSRTTLIFPGNSTPPPHDPIRLSFSPLIPFFSSLPKAVPPCSPKIPGRGHAHKKES